MGQYTAESSLRFPMESSWSHLYNETDDAGNNDSDDFAAFYGELQ